MSARLFAPVLALAVVPFAVGADEENPYKKAKVGDYATYKLTTKAGGQNVEGTLTQTVTAKDDREITIEITGKVNNVEIQAQKDKIDLTKPFDPTKAGGPTPGLIQNVQKLKDGTDKVKVKDKTYDARWETYKVKAGAMGMTVDSEWKVWRANELPMPVVKVEVSADVMGTRLETLMELTESGSGKEPKKESPDKKDAPVKSDVKKDPPKN